MPGPTLTLAELADELGRRENWVSRNWPDMVQRRELPPPISTNKPHIWNRAQVYAYLDQHLPREMRAAAAAYRAAFAAACNTPMASRATLIEAQWEHRLNARFADDHQTQEG